MYWYMFQVIWCCFWTPYWLSLLSYLECEVSCWQVMRMLAGNRLNGLIALNFTEHARFAHRHSEGRYCGFPTADWYQKNSVMLLLCCRIWFGYDWIINVFDEKWKWNSRNMQIMLYLQCFVISCRAKPLCFWKKPQRILILLESYLNNGYEVALEMGHIPCSLCTCHLIL